MQLKLGGRAASRPGSPRQAGGGGKHPRREAAASVPALSSLPTESIPLALPQTQISWGSGGHLVPRGWAQALAHGQGNGVRGARALHPSHSPCSQARPRCLPPLCTAKTMEKLHMEISAQDFRRVVQAEIALC